MTRLEIEVMRTLIVEARGFAWCCANVTTVSLDDRLASLDRWNDAVKAANTLIAQSDNAASGADLPLFT